VRRFALGFPGGGAGIHGEAVTESDEAAAQVAAWIEGMKSALRGKAGAGTLDALAVSREGVTLQFSASGEGLLSGDAGKSAMHSQFGVELYSLLTAGYPGLPSRTAPEEKVLAVKTGMKREDLLTLLGQPLSVYAIQGLDPPRETWSYQVPFGKQYLVRLDGGVVAAAPK
jgi:hypothetical protein